MTAGTDNNVYTVVVTKTVEPQQLCFGFRCRIAFAEKSEHLITTGLHADIHAVKSQCP